MSRETETSNEIDGDGVSSVGSGSDLGEPRNEAVEIVEGKVEKVSVSKHPEASIPQTELSLADIQRSQSHPVRWALYILLLFLAIIGPYWFGRDLAAHHTARVVYELGMFAPRGLVFISWTVMIVLLSAIALSIVEEHAWLWRVLVLFMLAVEQLIAGACLLRFDFWHSTYAVYGSHSVLPAAVDLGIVAALFAVAVYAVVFVGLLIGVKRTSPLNVLTRSWAAFLMFFFVEVAALLIALFGGLLPSV
jgi:hypothetical protein